VSLTLDGRQEDKMLTYFRRQGIAKTMLGILSQKVGATSIFAKCPTDLESNGWYKAMGFIEEGVEETKTGRQLQLWRLRL